MAQADNFTDAARKEFIERGVNDGPAFTAPLPLSGNAISMVTVIIGPPPDLKKGESCEHPEVVLFRTPNYQAPNTKWSCVLHWKYADDAKHKKSKDDITPSRTQENMSEWYWPYAYRDGSVYSFDKLKLPEKGVVDLWLEIAEKKGTTQVDKYKSKTIKVTVGDKTTDKKLDELIPISLLHDHWVR